MLLEKSHSVFKKMNKIANKLNIESNFIPIINISKEGLSNNKIMINLIDYNVSIIKNTIYDNLDYICKELDINIKITEVELITEIIYSFDFDKNIYKIFYCKIKNSSKIEKFPKVIYNIVESNDRTYKGDKYTRFKTEDNIEKYDFLKKYRDTIKFYNYDYFLEKKRNNSVEAILMKISYAPKWIKVNKNKLLINRLFRKFDVDKNTIKDFIEKFKKYKIEYIGFSDNYIKLYLL